MIPEHFEQRRTQRGTNGFIPLKMPKLNLTTDAEYVANLVNIKLCGCKHATVQFITWLCYLHNDIFLTDIIGYDQLKFIPESEILGMPVIYECLRLFMI